MRIDRSGFDLEVGFLHSFHTFSAADRARNRIDSRPSADPDDRNTARPKSSVRFPRDSPICTWTLRGEPEPMRTSTDSGTETTPVVSNRPPIPGDAPREPSMRGRRKLAVAESARGRILKYKADRGPVAYVLAMFALHLALWWYASPLVALQPRSFRSRSASMFIAPINHHHQHLNTFRSAR